MLAVRRPTVRSRRADRPAGSCVALLHFLTAVATAGRRCGGSRSPGRWLAEAVPLATFACTDPWPLVGLLPRATVPPLVGAPRPRADPRVSAAPGPVRRPAGRPGGLATTAGSAGLGGRRCLLVAVLIRGGTVPAHCWVTDWFEHASFGNALLFVAPLTGVYAAVRLVLPIAPDWVLQGIGLVSLVTAVYAAGMAIVQREARRFFAYLFLSHASLVLVGLELHTRTQPDRVARCLWLSVILSLGGLGLTLRALEARFGRLSLTRYHGLYEHCPGAGVCFLLTGWRASGSRGRRVRGGRDAGRRGGRRRTRRSGSPSWRGGAQRDRRGAGVLPAVHRRAARRTVPLRITVANGSRC